MINHTLKSNERDSTRLCVVVVTSWCLQHTTNMYMYMSHAPCHVATQWIKSVIFKQLFDHWLGGASDLLQEGRNVQRLVAVSQITGLTGAAKPTSGVAAAHRTMHADELHC